MRTAQPAEVLQVHITEGDRHEGRPLYEAVVALCREMKIAGATVFLGLEGYGETAGMHRAHLVHSDRPVVVTIVDTAENVQRIMTAVEPLIPTGVMTISQVEMIRVERRLSGV